MSVTNDYKDRNSPPTPLFHMEKIKRLYKGPETKDL